MGSLSAWEKDRLLRLVSQTAQDYPLGGSISTDCFTLPANTVGPGIQQLAEKVCNNSVRMDQIEDAIDSLERTQIINVGGVYFRLATYQAQGPLGTAAPGRPALRNDTSTVLLYWDTEATIPIWYSVHSLYIGWGRNALNASGYLRVAGASPITTIVGLYPPWGYNMYAMSGVCDDNTIGGPTNCEMYIWNNGVQTWTYQWPNNTRAWSTSFGVAHEIFWVSDLRIQIAAFSGPTNYPDNPRVGTWHHVRLNDGVTP